MEIKIKNPLIRGEGSDFIKMDGLPIIGQPIRIPQSSIRCSDKLRYSHIRQPENILPQMYEEVFFLVFGVAFPTPLSTISAD